MISDNVKKVVDSIQSAAEKCDRDPADITLVGVSKTRAVGEIEDLLGAGVVHLGENRVQEAAGKIPSVAGDAVWHLIGHLQSNKAKKAAELFDWIDSVDSIKLADIIAGQAVESGKNINVLIQVNVSGERSKSGIQPEEIDELASQINEIQGLTLRGLMTIGSFSATESVARAEFVSMRELFDELRGNSRYGADSTTLSMGMSNDFMIAIEEGATMVRVGTALFGERY